MGIQKQAVLFHYTSPMVVESSFSNWVESFFYSTQLEKDDSNHQTFFYLKKILKKGVTCPLTWFSQYDPFPFQRGVGVSTFWATG